MKKFFLAIAAMALTAPAFAQFSSGGFDLDKENVYYGIRLGITAASISSSDADFKDLNSKVGMTLGGVIGLRCSKTTPIFLESGLYYTQRGGKGDITKKWQGYETPTKRGATANINYLEIPILIKYGIQAGDNIAILPYVGPYFAMAIAGDTKLDAIGELPSEKPSSFDSGYFNRPDMGFKLGCGLEYNNLYVEVGYQFGVANIADGDDVTAHGNAFIANFGVNF